MSQEETYTITELSGVSALHRVPSASGDEAPAPARPPAVTGPMPARPHPAAPDPAASVSACPGGVAEAARHVHDGVRNSAPSWRASQPARRGVAGPSEQQREDIVAVLRDQHARASSAMNSLAENPESAAAARAELVARLQG